MNYSSLKTIFVVMRYVFWFCLLFPPALLAQEPIDSTIIPAKTEIFITLDRTISTRSAQTGDRFHGRVAVPITVNDKIVVPEGSFIIGYVDFTKQPGRLKGKGEIRLRFDTLILPSGTTRKMLAAVQSAEEQTNKPGTEDGTLQSSKGSQGEDTAKGAAQGGTIGGAVGGIADRSWTGLGVGAAVGAATGALIGIFKKGDQLVLPRGSSVTIQLEEPMQFVKP